MGSAVLVAIATAGALLPPLWDGTVRGRGIGEGSTTPRATFVNQPLSFVENRGQVDRRVAYYAHGGGASLFFTPRGVTFALAGRGAKHNGWAVQQAFVGARATASPHASRPGQGVVNSFVGQRSEWQTGLKLYGRLAYRDVWPGIDVVYSARANSLEYSFVIRPGADPRAIRLAYRGARTLRLTGTGRLDVSTPVGAFAEHRPIAYQRVGGRRVPVSASFTLARAGHRRSGDPRYGFRLGGYDASQPVVIDPVVFRYAGFLGGSGDDESFDTAVNQSGRAYMTGSTTSPDFPATPGPLSTPRGDRDAFVAKVDPTGRLVYADYIGGAGNQDTGRGVAVDQNGNAYIVGGTDSRQTSFPVTVGPDLTYNGGGEDMFVAKVNPTGTKLLYAGYIGGAKGDGGRGISVDANGYAYVAGTTSTVDSTFPAKVGPQLTYGGGNHDGFVAKVDTTGTGLVYCSYIGGAGHEDNVRGTAPDASGNVYITGHADSSEATFPVTVGPDLTYNGNNDGYVGKINPNGTAFVYLGYVGGSDVEQPRRIAIDSEGNGYIAGSTVSTDFPVTVGPDPSFGPPRDAFVTKVNNDGTGLVYSGFIGGNGNDQVYDLDVDAGGSAYVVGLTTSTERTFPVSGGPDLTYNGAQDGFIGKVNAAGTGLDYLGYIGGDGTELAKGVGVDAAGRASVSGTTTSTEATFPTLGAPDASYNGGQSDVFLAQVAPVNGAHITVTPDGAVHAGVPFTVTAVMRDGAGHPVTTYNGPATWTSADGAISPAAPADFVNGVSSTQATIGAPFASDRITIASGGATGQSARFNVLGPLDHIAISGVPSSVPAGQDFTVRATAKDSLNNTITDYAAPATWFDRSGTLTPASPSDFVNGVTTTIAHVTVPYHDDRITLTSNSVTARSAQFNVVSP